VADMRRVFVGFVVAAAMSLGHVPDGWPGEPGQGTPPRSGDSFRRQLLTPATVTWTQNPLRDALGELSRQGSIAVWLDRRVDPDQRVDFVSPRDATLDALLHDLARHIGLGVAYVDSVVYVGPTETASVLATVAEARLDAARRDRLAFLSRKAPLSWPELTEPRSLLARIADGNAFAWSNLGEVPHDLWPAADWPAIPRTHQLTLLLAGFDRSFEWTSASQTLRIVPVPRIERIERNYGMRGDSGEKLAELRRRFPGAELTPSGARLRAVASAEDHFWIQRTLQGLPSLAPRGDTPREVRYTLRTTAPFGGLAKAIADRLELQLDIDPRLESQSARNVMLDVKEVTRDELLRILADAVGATYEVRDGTLIIRPR